MSKTSNLKSKESMFHPDKSVVKRARIKDYDNLYVESITNREEFWAKEAQNLSWYK
jgi:acetyl-CoA synthetase